MTMLTRLSLNNLAQNGLSILLLKSKFVILALISFVLLED